MRILVDDATLAQSITVGQQGIHPVDPFSLTSEEQTLLSAVSKADATWFGLDARTSDHSNHGLCIVVREAERSHLDVLADLSKAGVRLDDGLALVASGGRFQGQRGRTWHAAPGNLQVVVHLDVDMPAKEAQAGVVALPAVAVADALAQLGCAVGVKWVNDLVLEDRKVGGVLTRSEVTGDRLRHVHVGIGLNVLHAPTLASGDATALTPMALADHDARFASPIAWFDVLKVLLGHLPSLRDALVEQGSATIIDRYRRYATFLQRTVTIWPVESDLATMPIAQGRVVEVLDDLSLRLEGHAEPIRSGRMRW